MAFLRWADDSYPFRSHQCSSSMSHRQLPVTEGISIHSSLLYVTRDNIVRDTEVKRIQPALRSLSAASVCALQNIVACNILQTVSMVLWVCMHDCLERGRERQVSCTVFTYKKWKTTFSFQGLWLTFHGWIVRYVGTKKHPFSLAYKCSNG